MKNKQKKKDNKKVDKQRRSKARQMTFSRYVETGREFDLPAEDASEAVLVAYVNLCGPLIEGHKNEVGSGTLAWRAGTVLNWLKARCDSGQLESQSQE